MSPTENKKTDNRERKIDHRRKYKDTSDEDKKRRNNVSVGQTFQRCLPLMIQQKQIITYLF
jgi:hypothetical protein